MGCPAFIVLYLGSLVIPCYLVSFLVTFPLLSYFTHTSILTYVSAKTRAPLRSIFALVV